jgi:hypothetical protein
MIKLNCSYEESKKIFELGYDFSKVCLKFYLKVAGMYGLDEGYYIRINDQDDVFQMNATISTYDEVWDHGISLNESYVKKATPIIPKAALEACLPLIDGIIWKRFPAAGDGLLRCTGLNHRTVETCTGFHEFLWCHEKYPEELKKKFDEVMA